MPSARPLWAFGKKKPMLAMEAEKFAPAMPMKATSRTKVSYDVLVSCSARPSPMMGRSSRAVVSRVEFLPPMRPGRYV